MTKRRRGGGPKKPDDVKAQAMEQLRKTRAKINEDHPELLAKIQSRLESQAQMSAPPLEQSELKIDRKKNMEAVMKLMEIRQGFSSEFKTKLKDVLKETEL